MRVSLNQSFDIFNILLQSNLTWCKGTVKRVEPNKCDTWTQDVNWTYIRRSEDVQDVF